MGITQQSAAARLIQPGVITNASERPASPYEGQCIYQLDTNQMLVWNGSAWVIPNQNTTNPDGLELIKIDTVTSGTSKEITDVFSSSYKNYLIKINNFNTTGAIGLNFRIGPFSNSSNYYWGGTYTTYDTNAVAGESGNNTSSWATGAVGTGTAGSSTIQLTSPFETTQTSYSCTSVDARVGGAGNRTYSGFQNNSNSYTSFTLILGSYSFLSCNVVVYGYRE